MKHFLSLLALLTLPAATLQAVNAPRVALPYLLPDGTTVQVIKHGDEHVHWLTDLEGRLLVQEADGRLRQAVQADSLALAERCERAAIRRAQAPHNSRHRAPGLPPETTFPTFGAPRSLVILVEYPNRSFLSPTAHDDFWAMLNEPDYSELGGTGSARDYFIAASAGQFTPDFDVAGPVMLSHPYSYYGGNDAMGEDRRPVEMIIEACQLIDDETDFSVYDTNGDGLIDNVFVFYAGYGEATCWDSDTVWPHSWEVSAGSSSPVYLDGVRLEHYACSNERSTSDLMDGVGTFVHEFSHVLGLPDLYSTQYTSAWTPGEWSVLDQGNYNNNSRTPAGMSAYERWCLGWLRPFDLTTPAHIELPALEEANVAAVVGTDDTDEYYFLENRQQTGFDSFLPGHGMLVWHIDYEPYIWEMNRVNNNGSHQYVDIIEADDIRSNGTMAGDPFPGSYGVTQLTAETRPAFTSWSGQALPPLTDIAETGDLVTFDFDGGGPVQHISQLDAPELLTITDVTASGFTARWAAVADADAYLLRLTRQAEVPDTLSTDCSDSGTMGLPAGWNTTANATYANAGYSGQSQPSLRLTDDGMSITTPTMLRATALEWWHRGTSSLAATDSITLEGLTADGEEWTVLHRWPICTASGGEVIRYEVTADDPVVTTLRLVFSRQGTKGSLAIDDLTLCGVHETTLPANEALDALRLEVESDDVTEAEPGVLTCSVTGLEPEVTYRLTLRALSGMLSSPASESLEVTTLEASALQYIGTDDAPAYSKAYNLWGQPVGSVKAGTMIVTGQGTGRKIWLF